MTSLKYLRIRALYTMYDLFNQLVACSVPKGKVFFRILLITMAMLFLKW